MNRFQDLLRAFIESVSPDSMNSLIEYVRKKSLSDLEIVLLARGMASSGKTFDFEIRSDKQIVDIPSTGGPGSLSTIIAPLILSALGGIVPKLGVKGRPAGGVDILSQIPGYQVELTQNEIRRIIKDCGYAHFLANDDFAPLDAKLFKYRAENGAKKIPELVIASLLSKKIAVGLTHTGLDVRVSRFGNFGTTWEEGRKNAIRFCKVAKTAGIEAKCFLTYGEKAYQPFIGRGEALIALSFILEREMPPELASHFNQCFWMANSIISGFNKKSILNRLSDVFSSNIIAQGSSVDQFKALVSEKRQKHVNSLVAPKSGFLSMDLGKIRALLVKEQNKFSGRDVFPDPAGIWLKSNTGQHVDEGDCIASYRYEGEHDEEFLSHLTECMNISPFLSEDLGFKEIKL